jgi:collagenase-like PrtC family protease
MKILSPFSKKEEILPLIQAGVDELYCGIIPPLWFKKYSALEILSRRGGFESNFSSFEDLKEAIQIAHSKKTPVFITLNVPYITAQYSLVMNIINKLCRIGADGFIVIDIGLLLLLKKYNIKKQIHIGTLGNVFNSRTVNFYKKLGANRIVLPRDLKLSEMENLIKKSLSLHVEFEAFILNTLCRNVDGLCNFFHNVLLEPKNSLNSSDNLHFIYSYDTSLKGTGCEINFSRTFFDAATKRKLSLNSKNSYDTRDEIKKYSDACGACQIPKLKEIGIQYLKVVERGRSSEEKVSFVRFLKRALNLLEDNTREEGYRNRVKELYKDIFKEDCAAVTCYYA